MRREGRAVRRTVLAAALAVAATGAGAPPPGGDVLPMTPENLDRLEKGLAAEEAARRELAAKAPKTKSPAEFDACRTSTLSGPDAMKLMEGFNAEAQRKSLDSAALLKAAEEMQRSLESLVAKRCGPDPSLSRPGDADRQRQVAEAAARDAGLSPRQYAILKERVPPFCALGGTPAGADGAKVKAPGGAHWVYSASEVSALKPRCAALMRALRVETR